MTVSYAELIHAPEGKTLEFKRDLSSPTPLLRTLTAFANAAGGRVLIGVTDDREVLGVAEPLAEEERLCNLIADSIAPRLVPNIELTTVEGKTLLIVEVFLSNSRPHWIKREGIDKGVYIRLGSSNRQADAQLVAEIQRGVAGVSFDALPMPALRQADLDLAALQDDFPERRMDEKTLLSLKLLVRHQGKGVPSQGAILLYGKDRRFHFDDAWIQCGRFIGNDKANIFDHTEIHDPLPKAVDSILLFLKKHAMRGADFSEVRRKDIWSIPLQMLREVVVNALVHADYSHRGTPFRVAFFDNRIEVESPGLLLPGMTVEEMKRGVSQIRNPVIARIFRELDLIEQWGSGVPGIFREAEAQQLPEPQIEEIAGRVRFTVFLREPVLPAPKQSRGIQEDSGEYGEYPLESGAGPGSGQSQARVRLESGPESQTAALVLEALRNEPLQRAEIAAALGHAQISGAIHRAVKELLQKQLIEYTIPQKPNSRLQRYRLTAHGAAWLQRPGKQE